MSEDLDRYRALIGRPFPGGEYTIAPWRAWLVADALGADPADPTPHPILAWMASVGGKGMTWDELFGWFDATAADGPMFGEHRTTLHRPLVCGAYRVTGQITSFERKVGRRTGTFDIVGYEFDLWRADEAVATCWNSLVLPRKGTL
ncbi:hypothetical protein [Gordonia hydrophobica]|uniref:N-terminal of MaoC-like dehydratase domain-containing protein n=1 Tax=Gordonia hydrophobica TaxID=40516 RepID=A0ABZ2TW88_9ACTN|nr:hypothetical protein [Gordonia hydrophobica]MBM7365837.1 hypothetical protein [Gordonia hydrophobica]